MAKPPAALPFYVPVEDWMLSGLIRCAVVPAVLVFGVSAASAEYRIQRDDGGQIGTYLEKFAQIRQSGQRVVIDGPCNSACTLALAVMPHNRICVTQNAVLGFHAAWMTDAAGHTVTSPAGTRLLMDAYPLKIKSWINRRGGLNGKTIYLSGKELAAIYPRCR